MTGTLPLSVAIITKNEEKRLPDCLKSVSFADEIVIVDSGSTDKTPDIAREFGCRFFVEEWKGDGPQKNSAVEKCSHEWVLVLDADERIPAETREHISRMLTGQCALADAYSFPRKSVFHGKWIKSCGWWPDRIVRLFKKGKGKFHSITHGQWGTTGVLEDLNVCIEHYSFSDYADMIRRADTYSTMLAQELFKKGKKAGFSTALLHGSAAFAKAYFLKRGFLDGRDGFVISLTKALGSFFKYAKLLELQRKDGK
ncbi:MAG: glycosyltransferase family 2 protein [Nitrospirota bacterium]